MTDAVAVWQQVDEALSTLLMVEVRIGLTFTQAATDALSTRECLRNRQLARQAYENARRWLLRPQLFTNNEEVIRKRLALLQKALRTLGDPREARTEARQIHG